MGDKLIVGPIGKGLSTFFEPFNIDNDSFPVLINAYQWRGRVKRKRGTAFLFRNARYFNSTDVSYTATATINLVANDANILTGFGLEAGNIVPGTVTITDSTTPLVYTDPTKDGYLTPTGTGGLNTINYATGDITLTSSIATATISVKFRYYPALPSMGLEDLQLTATQFPGTISFDTVYAYSVSTSEPNLTHDVSFFKNPATGLYTNYVQKTNPTAFRWNGEDYQQFFTANYENALFATNGINVPFVTSSIGMQFKAITVVDNITAGPATADLTITSHGLVIGDFVYINEVATTTGINFQTGYVTAVPSVNKVTVTFPNATITGNGTSGIAQYLTSNADSTVDCMRFFDGDPTNGSATTPVFSPGSGWVNFCPPLSQKDFTIANLPADQYYLVTARLVIAFRDRLLFIGPVVQNALGSKYYLQDTVVYSQNGTPYYTSSFTSNPIDEPALGNVEFTPILVPINQTATGPAWFGDQTGFGGWISAGNSQPITTVSPNADVLIVGFSTSKSQIVYSGNDIIPFIFHTITSEHGDDSTFSTINTDQGVMTKGSRGIIITNRSQSERIDMQIPDEVFKMNLNENGNERFCAIRDFVNEWIFFTYSANNDTYKFPDTTLLYNYRDQSWAIWKESYTTYGRFVKTSGFTWATVGGVYPTWEQWNDPWNANVINPIQPMVIAGNQQGYVVQRNVGTAESFILSIQSFSGDTVTAVNHNLQNNDYISINECLGTIAEFVNGEIFSVQVIDADTFTLNPDPEQGAATYFGLGQITKYYVPFIQTKQFPSYLSQGKKTRIGVQQYLLSTTANAQMTLQIYLSQNAAYPYTSGPIVPTNGSLNNALIYSTILYTCPESTNLGLSPANTNIQTPNASQQSQIWHRKNTSLIGDSVQLGFTISDQQMRSYQDVTSIFAITGATQANPCVLTTIAAFQVDSIVEITGVEGMDELNDNRYQVTASDDTTVTLNVDSTSFTAYISGGSIVSVAPLNATSEIELHGFILDLSPSQMLV